MSIKGNAIVESEYASDSVEILPMDITAHALLAELFGPTIRMRQINRSEEKVQFKIEFKGTVYFDPANGITHIGIYKKDIEA